VKAFGIIAAVIGLGAVAWYFFQQKQATVPVGAAAPDPLMSYVPTAPTYAGTAALRAVPPGTPNVPATQMLPPGGHPPASAPLAFSGWSRKQ
jgi:hypothetical protein